MFNCHVIISIIFVAEEPKQLTEEEIKAREQQRQEKARKLQEALQPKTLDDIRKARAMKKVFEPVKGKFRISYVFIFYPKVSVTQVNILFVNNATFKQLTFSLLV